MRYCGKNFRLSEKDYELIIGKRLSFTKTLNDSGDSIDYSCYKQIECNATYRGSTYTGRGFSGSIS